MDDEAKEKAKKKAEKAARKAEKEAKKARKAEKEAKKLAKLKGEDGDDDLKEKGGDDEDEDVVMYGAPDDHAWTDTSAALKDAEKNKKDDGPDLSVSTYCMTIKSLFCPTVLTYLIVVCTSSACLRSRWKETE